MHQKVSKNSQSGNITSESTPEPTADRAVTPVEPRRELMRKMYKDLNRISRIARYLLIPVIGMVMLAVLGLGCYGVHLASLAYFSTKVTALWVTAALPLLLVSFCISHTAGNLFLQVLSGLSRQKLAYFATHLPSFKSPDDWPDSLRRWVYHGDWLIEGGNSLSYQYIRGFVTGDAPGTIDEELRIWQGLGAQTAPGSARDLACVKNIPTWVRTLAPGTDLRTLEFRIGAPARKWAMALLAKAQSHLIVPGDSKQEELYDADFRFYYCRISGEREGLFITISPRIETSQSVDLNRILAA